MVRTRTMRVGVRTTDPSTSRSLAKGTRWKRKKERWDSFSSPSKGCIVATNKIRSKPRGLDGGMRFYSKNKDDGSERGESTQLSTEDASCTIERFVSALMDGDLEKVVDELPDEAKDLYYEKFLEIDVEPRMKGIHFPVGLVFFGALQDTQVLRSIEDENGDHYDESFRVDSFFKRVMLYSKPICITPLSSLRISRGRFLRRYEVHTESGEMVVFNVCCQLENSLQPCYKSVEVLRRWSVTSVKGECTSMSRRPCVELSPEAVVEIQIGALKNLDFETVFAFASPANRSLTGPLDKFIGLLNTPFYIPLVGYTTVEVLYSEQVGVTKYVQRIMVTAKANLDACRMADAVDPSKEQDKIWIGPLLLSDRRTSEPIVTIIYEWQVGLTCDFSVSPDEQYWMTDAVKPLLGPASSMTG